MVLARAALAASVTSFGRGPFSELTRLNFSAIIVPQPPISRKSWATSVCRVLRKWIRQTLLGGIAIPVSRIWPVTLNYDDSALIEKVKPKTTTESINHTRLVPWSWKVLFTFLLCLSICLMPVGKNLAIWRVLWAPLAKAWLEPSNDACGLNATTFDLSPSASGEIRSVKWCWCLTWNCLFLQIHPSRLGDENNRLWSDWMDF